MVGEPAGIFDHPELIDGDAGFFLALTPGGSRRLGLRRDAAPGPEGYNPIRDAGPGDRERAASDPLTQVTRYGAGPRRRSPRRPPTERGPGVHVRWDVENTSGRAIPFKALAAADFFFEGSDRGHGHLHPGAAAVHRRHERRHRPLGRLRQRSGPVSTWSAYQVLGVPRTCWEVVVEDPLTSPRPRFNNSVVSDPVDNAGGVEWDQYATPGLRSATPRPSRSSCAARSPPPSSSRRQRGRAQVVCRSRFTATAIDTVGRAVRGPDPALGDRRSEPASGVGDPRRRPASARSSTPAPTPAPTR